MKQFICSIIIMALIQTAFTQSVAINNDASVPDASAMLDVKSTSKGMLVPRMTTAQRTAIVSPATGLLVFDNTNGSFWFYTGVAWTELNSGGINNYWTNNGFNIYNTNSGNIGIGTSSPSFKFDVQGRMRVKAGTAGNINTSAGIWMDDYRNGTNQFFFGMKDSIRGGFYGSGSGVGWNTVFNTRNGNFENGLKLKGTFSLYSGTTDYFGGHLYSDSNDVYLTAKRGLPVNSRGNLLFQVSDVANGLVAGAVGIGTNDPKTKLHVNGTVMIGSGNPATGYTLSVDGKIISEEVKVLLKSGWPDYVFADQYPLRSFEELRRYISINNHLPNIPGAKEIESSGLELGEMQRKMMEKIEELTLYILQLESRLKQVEKNK